MLRVVAQFLNVSLEACSRDHDTSLLISDVLCTSRSTGPLLSAVFLGLARIELCKHEDNQ